jgi:hypothetical protein
MSEQPINELELVEPEPPMFGEDLRIDSEDEENLENLPEIERELILEERFRILQKYKEEKALYDKFARKDGPVMPEKTKLAMARTKRPADRSPRVYEDESMSSSSSSDSDSSYSSESEPDDEEAVLRSQRATAATDQVIAESMSQNLTVDIVRKIQLTRDMLLNSFQKVPNDLRNEALIDAFIRVPNGHGGYIIGQIVSVEDIPRHARKLETGKFELVTNIPNPESQTTRVPIASVSNSEITDGELESWLSMVGEERAQSISRYITQKIGHIKTVVNFVWDDSVINRMLEEKKRTNRANSVKLTLEIAKLRTTLQAELSRLNNPLENDRRQIQENIEKLNSEIIALEKSYKVAQRAFEEANAHQYGIVAINHRNRTEQRIQEMEEARKRHHRRLQTSTRDSAEKELNPFKRRECKPVVMWDVGKRSPKKEPQSQPQPADVDMTTPAATKNGRTKIINTNIESLVRDVSAAIGGASGTSRLASIQKSMMAEYTRDKLLPVWENQLVGIKPGEIMSFSEWKRRVAEDEEP